MLSEYDHAWCTKLLTELTKWPTTSPFRMPVDPIRDGAPNYLNVIKTPMDFHTMKKKLANSVYRSVQEFIDDIQLICDNAKLFNGPSSIYGLICDDIMAEVHRQHSEKPASMEEEWYKALLKATQALEEHMRNAPVEVIAPPLCQLPPNFATMQLSAAQRDALANSVGTTERETLAKRWSLFNEAARNQILSIIGESGRK
jgi:hypothetical protein